MTSTDDQNRQIQTDAEQAAGDNPSAQYTTAIESRSRPMFRVVTIEIGDEGEDWLNGRPRARFWANYVGNLLVIFIPWGAVFLFLKWIKSL